MSDKNTMTMVSDGRITKMTMTKANSRLAEVEED